VQIKKKYFERDNDMMINATVSHEMRNPINSLKS